MRVVTVIGTRPEIIRLSSTLRALDSTEGIEHIIIHTGQNYDYELNEVFFRDLDLRKPDYMLGCDTSSLGATIGDIFKKLDKVLLEVRPDAILVDGDTNSCLGAYIAKRRGAVVFHMEAGNRCFDQRVPEETNRRLVDHISDINLTYSDIAREYLISEGIPADQVVKTGSPIKEAVHYVLKNKSSEILKEMNLNREDYMVLSAHRQENVDSKVRLFELVSSVEKLSKKYGKQVIFSVHPRTANNLKKWGINLPSTFQAMRPLGLVDYLELQKNSFLTISDSGTINEEASILNFHALNLRESFERPEAMEKGVTILTGLNSENLLRAASVELSDANVVSRVVSDYNLEDVGIKVVKIILSYTHYIRRKYGL